MMIRRIAIVAAGTAGVLALIAGPAAANYDGGVCGAGTVAWQGEGAGPLGNYWGSQPFEAGPPGSDWDTPADAGPMGSSWT